MREHRIFHPEALQTHTNIVLDDNATRHVVQVLRLKAGDSITLFDGSGRDYAAKLLVCGKNNASAAVQHKLGEESPAKLDLHLAMGIARGERMDFSIQKAVELGISRITPLFTERTLVQLRGHKLQNRLAHWQGVIRHACGQSGRSYLPILQPAQSLNSFVTAFDGSGILLDHRANTGLNQLDPPQQALTLLVGPEGGLAAKERDQATNNGFIGVRLGPRVMRTETAPLAALAAIQMLWGDFHVSG